MVEYILLFIIFGIATNQIYHTWNTMNTFFELSKKEVITLGCFRSLPQCYSLKEYLVLFFNNEFRDVIEVFFNRKDVKLLLKLHKNEQERDLMILFLFNQHVIQNNQLRRAYVRQYYDKQWWWNSFKLSWQVSILGINSYYFIDRRWKNGFGRSNLGLNFLKVYGKFDWVEFWEELRTKHFISNPVKLFIIFPELKNIVLEKDQLKLLYKQRENRENLENWYIREYRNFTQLFQYCIINKKAILKNNIQSQFIKDSIILRNLDLENEKLDNLVVQIWERRLINAYLKQFI